MPELTTQHIQDVHHSQKTVAAWTERGQYRGTMEKPVALNEKVALFYATGADVDKMRAIIDKGDVNAEELCDYTNVNISPSKEELHCVVNMRFADVVKVEEPVEGV